MTRKKLRLEIQRSVENGDYESIQTPQWHGHQHAITTDDITGSVMKILITDSKGKLITITIDENGTIHAVNGGNEVDKLSETESDSTNLEGITVAQKSVDDTPVLNLDNVKKEPEEYVGENQEENTLESSLLFKEVLGIESEGYHMEISEERELQVERDPEIERIRNEETYLAGQFETVYIDSDIMPENYEISRPEENSDFTELNFESPDDPNVVTSRCRLCATQRSDMIQIFETNEAYKNIVDKINDCLPIKVKSTDDLPKQVCRLCLEKLELCHKFYKIVVEAEKQFSALREKTIEFINVEEYRETSTPCREQQPGADIPTEELESDKNKSVNEASSSISPTKSPELLNNEEKIAEKDNTVGNILTVEGLTKDATGVREAKNRDTIKCRICGLYFATVGSCYTHSIIHSLNNYYPCSMCHITSQTRTESFMHSLQHASRDLYQRTVKLANNKLPNKNLISVQAVRSGKSINSAEKGTEEVDSNRDSASNAKESSAVASDDQIPVTQPEESPMIICRICEACFGSLKNCYAHSKTHVKGNDYPCCICDKTFTNQLDCYVHNLQHREQTTSETPLLSMIQNQALLNGVETVVQRSNNDETPVSAIEGDVVKCRICGKFFGTTRTCHIHAEIHASPNYHPCGMCNKVFTNQMDCYRHSIKHSVRKPRYARTDILYKGGVYGRSRRLSLPVTENNESLNTEGQKSAEKDKNNKSIPQSGMAPKIPMPNCVLIVDDWLKCRLCHMHFQSPKMCYLHSKTHYSENHYPCNQCNKVFIRERPAFLHRLEHEKPKKQGRQRRTIPFVANNLGPPPVTRSQRLSKIVEKDANEICAPEDDEYKIKCTICEAGFDDIESCFLHASVHASKNRHPCTICYEHFRNRSKLKLHGQEHGAVRTNKTKNKPFCCSICGTGFRIQHRLEFHKACHRSKSKPGHCIKCKKNLRSEDALYLHVKKNPECQVTYSCNVCGEKFSDNLTRYRHRMNHKRPFQCEICKKSFVTAKNLKQHNHQYCNTQNDRQNNICSHCGKLFLHSSSLKKHLKCHNRARYYSCDFCSLRFVAKETRNEHQKTHPIEGSIKCELCKKRFYDPLRLQEHQNSVHSSKPIYNCQQCYQTFDSINSRNDHNYAAHSMEKSHKYNSCDEHSMQIHEKTNHEENIEN